MEAVFGRRATLIVHGVSLLTLLGMISPITSEKWCLSSNNLIDKNNTNVTCLSQSCPGWYNFSANQTCFKYRNISCSDGSWQNVTADEICSDRNATYNSCRPITISKANITCPACHDSCEKCSGPGVNDCSKCKKGYHWSDDSAKAATTERMSSPSTTTSPTTVAIRNNETSSTSTLMSSRITRSVTETTSDATVTNTNKTLTTPSADTTTIRPKMRCEQCSFFYVKNSTVGSMVKNCTDSRFTYNMSRAVMATISQQCAMNFSSLTHQETWCCPAKCQEFGCFNSSELGPPECILPNKPTTTKTPVTTTPKPDHRKWYVIGGAGGGGALLIIVLIVVIILVCRRNRSRRNSAPPPPPGIEELTLARENNSKDVGGAFGSPQSPGIQTQELLINHEKITRYTPDPLRKFPDRNEENTNQNLEEEQPGYYGNVDEVTELPSTFTKKGVSKQFVSLYGQDQSYNMQQDLPIYGNEGAGQQDLPIYGNEGAGQLDLPIYGNEGAGQLDLPIYGNEGAGQLDLPIYGNDGQGLISDPENIELDVLPIDDSVEQDELPVYDNEDLRSNNHRATKNSVNINHNRPPTYINLDKNQQEEFRRIFGENGNNESTAVDEDSSRRKALPPAPAPATQFSTPKDNISKNQGSMIASLSDALKNFKKSQRHNESQQQLVLAESYEREDEKDGETEEQGIDNEGLLPDEDYENLTGETMRSGRCSVPEEEEEEEDGQIYENFQMSRRH